jgi:hypothetical protein
MGVRILMQATAHGFTINDKVMYRVANYEYREDTDIRVEDDRIIVETQVIPGVRDILIIKKDGTTVLDFWFDS